MTLKTVELPDIGDFQDVPVIELHVKAGDIISIDDPIITVESDKATMDVPSPVAGKVSSVLVQLGAMLSQGSPLLEIEGDGAGDSPSPVVEGVAPDGPAKTVFPDVAPIAAVETIEPSPTPVTDEADQIIGRVTTAPDVHATPSVRAFARELGIDLAHVRATGPKGRILRDDVLAYAKGKMAAPGGSAGSDIGAGLPPWPQVDFAKYGEIERQPLTRIQTISGANLARNAMVIPHVANFDNADVTELEDFRKAINDEQAKNGLKLTMVAFLLKASAMALLKYPRFNSSLDGEDLVLKKYVHIAFAVDTPRGLMVPVIRDCDKKGLLDIAREMGELSQKARDGALQPSDMQGACFTVSSLGGIGGAGFTPIINAPEVAILGAARSQVQPVWNGAEFAPRLITPLSLSWDHRVVDGVAAARFLGHIASLLGDFRRALL